MSGTEESPAQKAARLRRERREAKIKAGGSARLDRITGLSGRPQVSAREESSPSPTPAAGASLTPPATQDDSQSRSQSPSQSQSPSRPQPERRSPSPHPASHTPNVEDQTPENIKAQEEYLKAMLRSQQLGTGNGQDQAEDPTAKLLSALLGVNPAAASGGAGTPPISGEAGPGAGLGAGAGARPSGGIPEISPNDLTSALGIPPSAASFFSRQTRPDSPAEQTRNAIFKGVHLIFAFLLAVYILFSFSNAVRTFGADPPPPSTAWNPFMLFVTGEVVLVATRLGRKVQEGESRGMRTWLRVFGDVWRDWKIVVFVLGMWAAFAQRGFTETKSSRI